MDAREIVKKGLWIIIPLVTCVGILLIVSAVGSCDIEQDKKLADATLGEVGALILLHAILVGSLSRK